MTVALPEAYRLTFSDWKALPDDGRLYEVLQGELLVTPPPSIAHQRISREIEFKLVEYLRRTGRGEVFYAPIGVKLGESVVLEPDLVIVLRDHAERIREDAIHGPPDLVVEILSPGTAGRDLGPKREAYEQAGIPEYWIVDPKAKAIEVLILEGNAYRREARYGLGDTLASPLLPDLAIELAAVMG